MIRLKNVGARTFLYIDPSSALHKAVWLIQSLRSIIAQVYVDVFTETRERLREITLPFSQTAGPLEALLA